MTPEEKTAVMKEYALHEGDTGSPEVQIAVLTKRINDLTEEKHLLESACEENEIAVRNKFPMARPGERIVRVERSDFSSMK